MKIDIGNLSERELIELNHRVVERLKFLETMRAHADMMEFGIGEKVRFHPSGGNEVIGVLAKYNKKTVTVLTEDGQKWNVSPSHLEKVKRDRDAGNPSAKVVRFQPK